MRNKRNAEETINYANQAFLSKYPDAEQLLVYAPFDNRHRSYILFKTKEQYDLNCERVYKMYYSRSDTLDEVFYSHSKKYAMIVLDDWADSILIAYLTENQVQTFFNNPEEGEKLAFNTWMHMYR